MCVTPYHPSPRRRQSEKDMFSLNNHLMACDLAAIGIGKPTHHLVALVETTGVPISEWLGTFNASRNCVRSFGQPELSPVLPCPTSSAANKTAPVLHNIALDHTCEAEHVLRM